MIKLYLVYFSQWVKFQKRKIFTSLFLIYFLKKKAKQWWNNEIEWTEKGEADKNTSELRWAVVRERERERTRIMKNINID
jgi:hypothetical protein